METGWRRPVVIDREGRESRFDLPAIEGDLQPTAWFGEGAAVILLGSERSATRLYTLAVADGAITRVPHPPGALAIGSTPVDAAMPLPDGRILTTLEDGTALPRVVALEAATGEATTLIAAPSVPRSRPWRSIDIPSTDGAVVQGWLATPDGPAPFPTIIDIHGGPADQENDRFAPANQAWLDRGYAVLMLNYRGSSGFGRAFESAIWGDPGRRELDDVVAARAALIDLGVADPGAVVPSGGSYGGYLTLLALTHRPSLWAAGVAYVAIADWTLMWEDGEALRAYQEALFGGPPALLPERYAEASPMSRVEDLRAPLLIMQGRSDPRCPPRQIERFADAARALGRTVEVDWFDAGHGHGGTAQRIAWQRRAMDFVDAALGRGT
jgi:dipeptidyl aminopeptidase/acylaminoacyl peptidase